MKLALATANPHKAREITDIAAGLPLKIVTCADFPGYVPPEETGASFRENAALKAVSFGRAAGLPCLADDSGLEVPALGGQPGVRSARYAGRDGDYRANNEKLLRAMEGLTPGRRGAVFTCVMALFDPAESLITDGVRRVRLSGGMVLLFEGWVSGVISREPRGEMGFGYDPVFIWPPAGLTFAEMDPRAKNAVSHRGRALRRVLDFLRTAEKP